ncbi:hypothetical protein [Lyngbya aestuarii]
MSLKTLSLYLIAYGFGWLLVVSCVSTSNQQSANNRENWQTTN